MIYDRNGNGDENEFSQFEEEEELGSDRDDVLEEEAEEELVIEETPSLPVPVPSPTLLHSIFSARQDADLVLDGDKQRPRQQQKTECRERDATQNSRTGGSQIDMQRRT